MTDAVVPDARGFIWGAPVASVLGTALHWLWKPGKPPPPVFSAEYDLEQGHPTLALSRLGILTAKQEVRVLDDVNVSGVRPRPSRGWSGAPGPGILVTPVSSICCF